MLIQLRLLDFYENIRCFAKISLGISAFARVTRRGNVGISFFE